MNWHKPIKFKIGDVDWEMPLSTMLLLIFFDLNSDGRRGLVGFPLWFGKALNSIFLINEPISSPNRLIFF